MRIVFVAPRYHINQHAWMSALQKTGHQVEFYAFQKTKRSEHYAALEPSLAKTKLLPKFVCMVIDFYLRIQGKLPRAQYHYWPVYSEFKKQILGNKPDLIIVRDALSPLSIVAFWIARKNHVPAILYNQYPLEAKETKTTQLLQFLKLVPKFRITPNRKSQLIHNKTTNTHFLPLITDFKYDVSKKKYLENGDLHILCIGKLNLPRKRLQALTSICSQLNKKYPIKLTIVGALDPNETKEYEKLKKQISSLNFSNNVSVLENLQYAKLPKIFMTHDVFVLPSVNEPYSISPIEAMNFGLPVIVTDTNGICGSIKDGITGFVISSNDDVTLSEKIRWFAENPSQVERMGNNAFKQHQQTFTQSAFIKHFDHVTKNCMIH